MAPQSAVLASAVFALLAASATAQTPSHTVTFADGLLSVQASQAPLSDVFDSLVSRGLVEVTGVDRLPGVVSIQMEPRPVAAVVTALLADFNFIITTRPRPGDPLGPLVVVRVHSRSGEAAAPTGPITIPELEALRMADREAETPDPDEESDPETQADHAAEESDRVAQFAELERAGAFDRKVPIDALADMREDDNPLVRARVLTELNTRDAHAAIAYLIQALGDEDLAVRDHAVQLLGRRSDAESLARLGATLVRSQDTSLRVGAFMALAMRADPKSAPFVEAVADDRDPTIRGAAASFLPEIARRSRQPAPPAGQPLPPR